MMKRYVVGFMFPVDRPGTVVLTLKQTKGKPGVDFMHGLLNGIGGGVEDGESGLDAMARESREETQLDPAWDEVAVLTDGTFQLEVFRAEIPSASAVPDSNDVGEPLVLVRTRDVVDQTVRTIPNLQWLVPMCLGADKAYWPFSIIQSVLD